MMVPFQSAELGVSDIQGENTHHDVWERSQEKPPVWRPLAFYFYFLFLKGHPLKIRLVAV